MSGDFTQAPAIAVSHLSFRYAESERWVLRDLSFIVAPGETVLLLGPSGSGKSTLALCLNGLIPHLIEGEMQGDVLIWGHAPTIESASVSPETSASGIPKVPLSSGGSGQDDRKPSENPARPDYVPGLQVERTSSYVGEVFQDPETQMVMPRLDEEIAFGLENMAVPQAEMPARIAAALGMVGLQARARDWVNGLSGGQKQRLALAAVLALRPAVLVLDEPTANLDPLATISFFTTLARLKASLGITIVLIEHRLDAALPLVDRVIAIDRQGQMLADGAPHDVFKREGDALQREGIWLPQTCRLAQALAQQGYDFPRCPLSLDEAEALLRLLFAEQTSGISHISLSPGGRGQGEHEFANTQPAVAISHLTFHYANGAPVLNDISLQIQRGRFFALVGANGSGKTTLARHLVGLLRPSSGTVEVLGRDVRGQSPLTLARQAGYVFQNPEHQFVTERVADELAYSLRGRFEQMEIDRRVSKLLHTFGLEGYEDANPFSISQGQKRRLSVATMVALEQPILILDEPSFGQDQQSTAALMSTLQSLHQQGVTIIFITHDMQLVCEYADEVAVLNAGRLLFQGSPYELFRRPQIVEQASLALPPLAELGRRMGEPGLLTIDDWLNYAERRSRIEGSR